MPKNISELELTQARSRLSRWMLGFANATADELGFGWQPTPIAPNTYKGLKAAFELSMQDGRPLPVSSENSTGVVFTDPQVNYAFRFAHDCHHVMLGLSFSSRDEFALARWQMVMLAEAGFTEKDLEWQLFYADAMGQVLYYALTKQFVSDQLRFALECTRHGVEQGLALEMARNAV
ncbi:hypothetical protein [Arthrobacter sp. CJ23]|uniref:hypothetical protein n=1 Tax=Arthrobacter sp. CJ23 TaxID=2972479 RepID=UPI00215BEE78|nr:hypothetical protein [Arthrobacter sp. CJ23]UVJ38061.1 hypothetical protein NVV90_12400 [Arthrobacter sp. CJ23]